MVIRLFCPACTRDAAQSGIPAVVDTPMPIAEGRDDGGYEVTCDGGHVTRAELRNLRFEVLFELGLNGLLDGYSREAVVSFTSSLEHFYNFYWCVACFHCAVPESAATAAWKHVSNQSERQIGMFLTAQLLLTK